MWFVLKAPRKGDRDGGKWEMLWSLPMDTKERAEAYLKMHGTRDSGEYAIAYAENKVTLGVHLIAKEDE